MLVEVEDDDDQGDTRLLLEDSGWYGLLVFGWGSCPGCDALQDCDSHEELRQLIVDLENDIRWFDSVGAMRRYFQEKDWQTEWFYHQAEWILFHALAITKLNELAGATHVTTESQ